MALSESQYRNIIKVIVVGAVAKEFRKSSIMKKITKNIKKDNLIATGELAGFRATGAILPSADDRFLVGKSGVFVKTVKIGPQQRPVATEIVVRIRYGLTEEKYFYLTKGSPNKKWFPNIDRIAEWIKVKKARGNKFTLTRKGLTKEANTDNEIRSVAYAIAKSISTKGIEKSDFLQPFEDKRYGVNASLARANRRINNRIFELYGTTLVDIQNDVLGNIL